MSLKLIRESLLKSMKFLHTKCRSTEIPYLNSKVFRQVVPEQLVGWDASWEDYHPTFYIDPTTIGKPWSDDENHKLVQKWNAIDDKIDRKSFEGEYKFDADGLPLNPKGRTGLSGKGCLGRWGPNHAADPIVSRLHRGKLQFIAIKRSDTGEWAIPGGMVDCGETISQTLKREFSEEALGNKKISQLDKLWENGVDLYKGYVDDHRNTDNAWMETAVVNFHDNCGLLEDSFLEAGDDAVNVRWVDVDGKEYLYASHNYFIELLVKHHVNIMNVQYK